ncbi:MAG: hypothetical protein WC405_19505 [Syntrophales bacterium]
MAKTIFPFALFLLFLPILPAAAVPNQPVFMASSEYAGGFSKSFRVYGYVGESGAEEYLTEITLAYRHPGPNQTLADFTIEDSVPRSVVSQPSQIVFITPPAGMNSNSSGSFSFSWHVKSISKGEEKKFTYRFYRAATPSMISQFAPPSLAPGARSGQAQPAAKPADTAASSSDASLIGSPLSYVCIGAASMFFLLLALSLVFKKQQKKQ